MKKLFIIIGTILCLICVCIDIWAIVVYTSGEQKEVSNTMEVDILTTTDDSDKQPFIEVNYYTNKKGNGLELFEVRYNFFVDENQDKLMSVGSQYVSNSKEDNIEWSTAMKGYRITKKERFGFLNLGLIYYYEVFFNTYLSGNNAYHEYQSSDNYETVMGNAINSISKNSRFKVTMGDKMYQLGLKFDTADEDFYLGYIDLATAVSHDINYRYQYVDQHLLAYDLYQSVVEASFGSNEYTIAKFANYFDYYEFDGKTYNKIEDLDNTKIKTNFENYYVIKVNKYEDGAKVATDSIFNTIKGDPTFNLDGEYVCEDYFYGRNIIKLDYGDFEKREIEEGKFVLVLKSSFLESYRKYKDTIVLDIDIEFETDQEFMGFVETPLSNFKILDCTVNGESYKLEVPYV